MAKEAQKDKNQVVPGFEPGSPEGYDFDADQNPE
jgi:hypothetical protein